MKKNLQGITELGEEYTIWLPGDNQSINQIDDEEEEALLLSNQECSDLKWFLEQEAAERLNVRE